MVKARARLLKLLYDRHAKCEEQYKKIQEELRNQELAADEKIQYLHIFLIESLEEEIEEVEEQVPEEIIKAFYEHIEINKPQLNIKVGNRVDNIFDYNGIEYFLPPALSTKKKKRIHDHLYSLLAVTKAKFILEKLKNPQRPQDSFNHLYSFEAQRLVAVLAEFNYYNLGVHHGRSDGGLMRGLIYQSCYEHIIAFIKHRNLNIHIMTANEIHNLIVSEFETDEWKCKIAVDDNGNKKRPVFVNKKNPYFNPTVPTAKSLRRRLIYELEA